MKNSISRRYLSASSLAQQDNFLSDKPPKKSKSKKKINVRKLLNQEGLLKVSKNEIAKLSNIIQHSVANKYYKNSNLKLITGNRDYQCSVYNLKAKQDAVVSENKKRFLKKINSRSVRNLDIKAISGVQDEREDQKIQEIQQTNEDIERIQKLIQKKDQEQHEQLSRDVYQAMVTAKEIPKMQVAFRTKDFICKERIKKDYTKDFLQDRVDTFFKEKQKEAEDLQYTHKFQRLLKKIASTATLPEQEKKMSKTTVDENQSSNRQQPTVVLQSRPFTTQTRFNLVNNRPSTTDNMFNSKVKSISTIGNQQQIDQVISQANDDYGSFTSGSQPMKFLKFQTLDNFNSAIKSFNPSQYNSNNVPLSSGRKTVNIMLNSQRRSEQQEPNTNMNSYRFHPMRGSHDYNSSFHTYMNLNQQQQTFNQQQQPNATINKTKRPKTAAQIERLKSKRRLLKSASAVEILSRNMVQQNKEPQYISIKEAHKANARKEKVKVQIQGLIESCQSFQIKSHSKKMSRQLERNYGRLVRNDERMSKKIEDIKEDILMARLDKFNYYQDDDEEGQQT